MVENARSGHKACVRIATFNILHGRSPDDGRGDVDRLAPAVESHDPEGLAREIQRAVLEHTRLWCSIGVGDTKLRAKYLLYK